MALFKLSEILEKGMKGITSKNVKIVRHAGSAKDYNSDTPYALYIKDPKGFLDFQSEQGTDLFKDVDYIVSFIAEEGNTARMIGVFKVEGYDEERKRKEEKTGKTGFYYKLSEVDAFKEDFSEQVIIDWGRGRRFCQRLKSGAEDKDVLAIERKGVECKFKSYEEVLLGFNALKDIINGNSVVWKNKLTAVKGIYVISDISTGELYVGAAYQEKEGIWGRWSQYVKTGGHCGNKILKNKIKEDKNYAINNFQWGILQTCSLRIADKDILHLEKIWKDKLGKKACVLNLN